MDFARGLRSPLNDSNWGSKVLIGTLVTLVPILNFAAIGYVADVMRNVATGRETPLPEWDQFGDNFVRGFLITVVQFMWMLPLLVVFCPLFVIVSLASVSTGNSDAPTAGFLLLTVCLYALYIGGALVLSPFMIAAQTRYAVTNSFSEALPGPVFRQVRGNLRPWLTVMLFAFGIGLIVGIVSICTFGLGGLLVLPFIFYIQLVFAHWNGQAYRESAHHPVLPPSMV